MKGRGSRTKEYQPHSLKIKTLFRRDKSGNSRGVSRDGGLGGRFSPWNSPVCSSYFENVRSDEKWRIMKKSLCGTLQEVKKEGEDGLHTRKEIPKTSVQNSCGPAAEETAVRTKFTVEGSRHKGRGGKRKNPRKKRRPLQSEKKKKTYRKEREGKGRSTASRGERKGTRHGGRMHPCTKARKEESTTPLSL